MHTGKRVMVLEQVSTAEPLPTLEMGEALLTGRIVQQREEKHASLVTSVILSQLARTSMESLTKSLGGRTV